MTVNVTDDGMTMTQKVDMVRKNLRLVINNMLILYGKEDDAHTRDIIVKDIAKVVYAVELVDEMGRCFN